MVLAGDKDAAFVPEARREGVEGTVPCGFSHAVYHGALVLGELRAKVQRGLRVALDAASKPVQQGLQVLPRILCVLMCQPSGQSNRAQHVRDASPNGCHFSQPISARVGLKEHRV